MKKIFSDYKVHIIAAAIVIIAELIGTVKIDLKVLAFSLIPMLFAVMIGILLGAFKIIKLDTMKTASPYIGISVLFLISKCACSIGPSWGKIVEAGPALILQEFGNLGTIILAMPIACLVFHMGRAAVGACFSISREPSIAIVADRYGLDGPEGQGIMGAYVTGTILGTVFYGILVSIFAKIGCFSPEAMAMAAGTGSASMMAASLAPLVEAFPEKAEVLQGFAATSNTLTNADGLYMSLLIGLPLTEFLYRLFTKKNDAKVSAKSDIIKTKKELPKLNYNQIWIDRIKVCLITMILASIANWIYGIRSGAATVYKPWEVWPALIYMFIISMISCVIRDLLRETFKIEWPIILWIALITTILSFSFCGPLASIMATEFGKIQLLPLCTPILAYAGISAGKDLDTFKKQGVAIVITALITFTGTWIGSAFIADIILKFIK